MFFTLFVHIKHLFTLTIVQRRVNVVLAAYVYVIFIFVMKNIDFSVKIIAKWRSEISINQNKYFFQHHITCLFFIFFFNYFLIENVCVRSQWYNNLRVCVSCRVRIRLLHMLYMIVDFG